MMYRLPNPPRRLPLLAGLLGVLVLLPACGDKPASSHRTAETSEKTFGNTVQVMYAPSAGTKPEPANHFVPAKTNAKHPIAGRSVFPEPDEKIDKPIAAKRLSDEDQFASTIDPADIPDIVPWQDAAKYVGHTITVEGRFVDFGLSRDGKVNFLNYDKDWRGKFYMVLFDDLAKTMDKSVQETFKGKLVRVTGPIEPHNGRAQMKIKSMDQVKFIDE